MNLVVAATTCLAAILGVSLGYDAAGIGGSILYGAVIGIGGAFLGSLMAKTVLLLRHWWRFAVTAGALILVTILTWGVYL